jgi:adenylate cyclase, class 2
MQTEIEVKILNINVEEIKKKLVEIGAENVAKKNQRRNIYSVIPGKINPWLRLRDEGNKVTLTLKHVLNDEIDGTQESEVIVDDFEKTNLILNKLGFFRKFYQENKRESYVLNNVEIEIDTWPMIPAYLEVEGQSKEEIEKMVQLLGFTMEQTTSINVKKVYLKYGIDIESIEELKFENENKL